MGFVIRRLRARIDVALSLGLALSAACSGQGGASNETTSAPTVAAAQGGASTSASSTSDKHQMFLLTQKGIDEDIGFVQSTTTFFDCDSHVDVGFLSPHKLLAVGYSLCGPGKAVTDYVKSRVGPSGRPADVATLVKLALSNSPDRAERIQAVARRDLGADPSHAALIATKMEDFAQGSGP